LFLFFHPYHFANIGKMIGGSFHDCSRTHPQLPLDTRTKIEHYNPDNATILSAARLSGGFFIGLNI
jgi:hypothetical protein